MNTTTARAALKQARDVLLAVQRRPALAKDIRIATGGIDAERAIALIDEALEGYNGWTNYETWAVYTHLSNDEGTYNYWNETAGETVAAARTVAHEREGVWTEQEAALYTLADRLKDEITDGAPERADVYGDLLGAALAEVEWTELAHAFLDERADYRALKK